MRGRAAPAATSQARPGLAAASPDAPPGAAVSRGVKHAQQQGGSAWWCAAGRAKAPIDQFARPPRCVLARGRAPRRHGLGRRGRAGAAGAAAVAAGGCGAWQSASHARQQRLRVALRGSRAARPRRTIPPRRTSGWRWCCCACRCSSRRKARPRAAATRRAPPLRRCRSAPLRLRGCVVAPSSAASGRPTQHATRRGCLLPAGTPRRPRVCA